MTVQQKMTFGVIVGNRGFFPDQLAKTGREEIIKVLEAAGAKAVVLSQDESKHGAVETYAESQRCAELFKKHPELVDAARREQLQQLKQLAEQQSAAAQQAKSTYWLAIAIVVLSFVFGALGLAFAMVGRVRR